MSAQSISSQIIAKTEAAAGTFAASMPAVQQEIMRSISRILRSLEIDSQGNLKPSSTNISLLRTLRDEMNRLVLTPEYLSKLEAFMKTFGEIHEITNQFFSGVAASFSPNKQAFQNVLALSIDLTKTSLTEAGINQFVIQPILDLVTKGITSGANIYDIEKSLRGVIEGDQQRLGGLHRYVSQITRDALNQFSRNYNEAISMDLGLEWYYYSGSIIEDTRSYCLDRAGKYFHKKEVENVPADWAGKIAGTDSSTIFVYGGGYNCRHLWMPVLINVVPKSVIDRNKANGNYSGTAI